MEELCFSTIAKLGALIRDRAASPVEITTAFLRRIERLNPHLNCFVQVLPERATAAAARAEAEIRRGKWRGPLHGVPLGLKDLFDVSGIATTVQSRLYEQNRAQTDADVVERLDTSGAVLLGKQTLWEFALGGISPGSLGQPARNPWNQNLDPGGSSSGSAAAVAAGLCVAALGSDTGGSIRHPAAWCGVAGFKPTYDLVSRRGAFPLAPTLDHVGILARSSEDCALMLAAISGSPFAPMPEMPKGVRLGLAINFLQGPLAPDPQTLKALHAAVDILRATGCEVIDVEIPSPEAFSDVGMLISRSEGHAIHKAMLEESPHLYGEAARTRLTVGGAIPAADYINAQRWRTVLVNQMAQVMTGCDVLILPTVPCLPQPLKEEDPAVAGWLMTYTRLFNLTGAPALSICTGFDPHGLPLAMQLAGRPGEDALVLQIGAALERALPHHGKMPPGTEPQ